MKPRNRFLLAAALFAAFYLLAWRPVRVWITNDVMRPAIERMLSEDAPLRFHPTARASFYVVRTDIQGTWERSGEAGSERSAQSLGGDAEKNVYRFNGFGNAFFLLGGLYFLAFGHGWRPVGRLFLLHQAITALSLGCLLLAVSAHPAWLYPMNLLVTYITPAATGLFVLTVGRRP